MDKNTQEAFFALVRAGLWSHTETTESTENVSWECVDWGVVYRLAEEQSVVGLVAAGIDTVNGSWLKVHGSPLVPQQWALQFIGQTLQIEQRNRAMNEFVARLISLLRKNDIYAILVKGQGIAQCYEKPLWRAAGDVDLFLNAENYEKASTILTPLATSIDEDIPDTKHYAMTIEGWEVELHGTMRSQLGRRIDNVIDAVQEDTFKFGNVRVWDNDSVAVYLPSPDNDIIFVFCHILQHFFKGGIGLRQVCDWCRMLWSFRDEINYKLLEERLREASILSEWKAFSIFAVTCLGMPEKSMPLHQNTTINRWRASQIMRRIMETGNFGHNKVNGYNGKSVLIKKATSLWSYTSDAVSSFMIFPGDSIQGLFSLIKAGLKRTFKTRKTL